MLKKGCKEKKKTRYLKMNSQANVKKLKEFKEIKQIVNNQDIHRQIQTISHGDY